MHKYEKDPEITSTKNHIFLGFFSMLWVSMLLLTIFTIIVIINAFNLIDGINGLSGSITVVVALTLGTWFYLVDKNGLAILAYSLAGAVTAFLKFNFTPARIFMGDTGALLLGLICSILVIKFIEINQTIYGQPYSILAGPTVAIGILILPLFDTARVFLIRILRGRSPFSPDRLHIHHLLVDFGFSHMQSTGLLVLTTISFIAFVLIFQSIGTFKLLFLVLLLAAVFSIMLQNVVERRTLNQK